MCSLGNMRSSAVRSLRKVLVPIANGSEELEAVTIIDTLARAGADVTLASVENNLQVTCSRGVNILANISIEECIHRQYDLICLPGGMLGSTRLQGSQILREILIKHAQQSHLIGAICAAPALVLSDFGLLRGKNATCYPAPQFRDAFQNASVIVSDDIVVQDGNIVTSQGPGTALEFSLFLVELIYGKETAEKLAKQMIYKRKIRPSTTPIDT